MRQHILDRGDDPENYPILRSKPDIWNDLVWVWEAYAFLSSARQIGFSGPQPLTLSEMLAYADYRGINAVDEREELLVLVQHLDRVFMNDYTAKTKKKT